MSKWSDDDKDGCLVLMLLGGCFLPIVAVVFGFAAILFAAAWKLLS